MSADFFGSILLGNSPSTGATLENKTVFPNLSLRSIIRSFTEARAAAAAAPSPPAV